MIMTKESYEAWMRMQHFCFELNFCFEAQYPWEEIKNDTDLFYRMETFENILDELCLNK